MQSVSRCVVISLSGSNSIRLVGVGGSKKLGSGVAWNGFGCRGGGEGRSGMTYGKESVLEAEPVQTGFTGPRGELIAP